MFAAVPPPLPTIWEVDEYVGTVSFTVSLLIALNETETNMLRRENEEIAPEATATTTTTTERVAVEEDTGEDLDALLDE